MSLHEQLPVVAGPPPRIDVRNAAGSVTVEALEAAEHLAVWVEALDDAAEELLDRVEIDLRAGDAGSPTRVRVAMPQRRLMRTPAFAVRISTPPDAAVRVAAASADVELTGSLGELEVTGASGDVGIARGTGVQVRTASGDARIATVEGRGSIVTASGDISIGRGLDLLKLRTASGDVSVEHAGGVHHGQDRLRRRDGRRGRRRGRPGADRLRRHLRGGRPGPSGVARPAQRLRPDELRPGRRRPRRRRDARSHAQPRVGVRPDSHRARQPPRPLV